jgi:hypothetical protein
LCSLVKKIHITVNFALYPICVKSNWIYVFMTYSSLSMIWLQFHWTQCKIHDSFTTTAYHIYMFNKMIISFFHEHKFMVHLNWCLRHLLNNVCNCYTFSDWIYCLLCSESINIACSFITTCTYYCFLSTSEYATTNNVRHFSFLQRKKRDTVFSSSIQS